MSIYTISLERRDILRIIRALETEELLRRKTANNGDLPGVVDTWEANEAERCGRIADEIDSQMEAQEENDRLTAALEKENEE